MDHDFFYGVIWKAQQVPSTVDKIQRFTFEIDFESISKHLRKYRYQCNECHQTDILLRNICKWRTSELIFYNNVWSALCATVRGKRYLKISPNGRRGVRVYGNVEA